MRWMSDSLALGAGSRPTYERVPPAIRWWRRSQYGLPLYTLALWGRCLVPLVLWFSVGTLGRYGLLAAGSELSRGSLREWRPAGFMLISVVTVMLGMVVTVGMLHSLRGLLTETRARRDEGEADEPLFAGLGRAIIVFVGIYLAWGRQTADARALADADMERYADRYDAYAAALVGNAGKPPPEPVPPDAGTGLVLDLKIAIMVTVVAVIARFVFAALHDRGGGARLGFCVAFCELAYTFNAAVLVFTFAGRRSGWVEERVAVAWWNDHWAALEAAAPWWRTAMEWLGGVRPHLVEAVLVPLTWLMLVILVFGAGSRDARALAGGSPPERAEAAPQRALRPVRRGARLLFRWSGLDRWPAVLGALRLTLRGGAPLFTVMCLTYMLIRVGADHAERAAYYLIGTAHRQLQWEVYQVPVRFGRELVFGTLTLCLFAAAFDVAATRQRAKRSTSPGE